MEESLSMILLERIAIIAVIAYVFSQTQAFRSLFNDNTTIKEKAVLVFFFSSVSIAGTYLGIPIEGAFANVRDTGSIVAGLLGGPLVGITTGLISGIHRITLGGFTAVECGITTIIGGALSGYIHMKVRPKTPEVVTGIVTGVGAVLFSMTLIMLFSQPHEAARLLVIQITVPMLISNVMGIGVFMAIFYNAREHQTKIGALQTNKALRIANATLPHFRQGLNTASAQKVAATIQQMTSAAAVAISDCSQILAHVGLGYDHHNTCEQKLHRSWDKNSIIALKTPAEIGCQYKNCPLKSALIVPLMCKDEIMGSLTIYYSKEAAMTALDIEFAQGLGQILSTQLEVANLQKMSELAAKAELKALRAQINPHFLFNALNTIVSLCRTDANEARHLLIELSDFFRRSLKSTRDFVSIQEELELVDSYLTLEKARFGQRLSIVKNVDSASLDIPIPSLTLQPLVENAVKHGLLARESGGTITITAKKNKEHVQIAIVDDGQGIPENLLNKILIYGFGKGTGVGLSNVNERLKAIYGSQYNLQIKSILGQGTSVNLNIPIKSEGVNI
jgi:two-component system sensor histidine kinase LytS